MGTVDLVLFDLDQTLVDSSALHSLRRERNWNEVYRKIPETTPFKGIDTVLRRLTAAGIKVGIVTSSPRPYCNRMIRQHHWHFDPVICFHDTAKHKPNPEPFILALANSGVSACKTITVGDDPNDIVASKDAEIRSAAALWGAQDHSSLAERNPTWLVKSPLDLLGIVEVKGPE